MYLTICNWRITVIQSVILYNRVWIDVYMCISVCWCVSIFEVYYHELKIEFSYFHVSSVCNFRNELKKKKSYLLLKLNFSFFNSIIPTLSRFRPYALCALFMILIVRCLLNKGVYEPFPIYFFIESTIFVKLTGVSANVNK